jgi:sec-independent protein translocase protein TatB
MFDIGFWEVIFIAVITLLVVGPERLPRVARTAGLWVGKIRGFVVSVKADIDQELAADELKRTLQKQAAVPEIEELIDEATGDLLSDKLSSGSKPAAQLSGKDNSGDVKDDKQS